MASYSGSNVSMPSYYGQSQSWSNSGPMRIAVKLADSRKEEENIGELAEYYAIIKATEILETAYSRDALSVQEYNEACSKLITQFKTTNAALISSGLIQSPEKFFQDYQVDCPRAFDRLVKYGVLATVMHGTGDTRSDVKIVAETVQAFITAMDCLKLSQWAVDQVQPLVSDLVASLNNVSGLPPHFEGLTKMKSWLQKLNSLRAAHILDEEDARQLSFDLENSYQAFHNFLSKK